MKNPCYWTIGPSTDRWGTPVSTGTGEGRLVIVSHWSPSERGFPEQWCHLSHFECGWKDASGGGRVDHVSDPGGGGATDRPLDCTLDYPLLCCIC